jgi:hypothetical protein
MGTNNRRLDRYFANVSRRKNSVSDWRIYAAVTGSAVAMATNASAGIIYFNQAVTAGPIGNVASSDIHQSQNIALKSAMGGDIGLGFEIIVGQGRGGGAASNFGFVSVSGNFEVLDSVRLKKLASGANISTAPGRWTVPGEFALRLEAGGAYGWAPSATGFAGFRFSTTNHALDYGWIRLSYTLGTNGLPNSVTAIDWAYDPTGAPVTAGEEPSSTPEPSTSALAILAAGAAGVAALGRRRQAAGENI